MKILHTVENYSPDGGGMQEVVRQLSERLAAMGHDVTVATKKNPAGKFTALNGVKIVAFEGSGNKATGLSGETEKYQDYLMESNFDIITFFAAQQFMYDAALDILPKIKAKKVSVPTGYSNFYVPAFKSYYEQMRSWIKHFDMNVYLSDDYRDINFAREAGVTKTILIPNAADEREFSTQRSEIDIRKQFNLPADCFLVLHVGNYTGKKGHKEAIEIFLHSNLKNAALLLIGNNTDYFKKRSIFKYYRTGLLWLSRMFSSKKITLTAANRETTVAAYKQANLFLFPSNIECSPIVLFEAMAAKTPFLVTNVGNSSEIAEWS
ncbi:MAG TPA: glycosyltransferase family 4 protein, partial [Bacteroidia bacterium]|nr:glycosyltransferase family 4 protein [Bacteroidia bacterium]